MYYGMYKGIRDGAWRCLLECKITTLPVDVISIAKAVGVSVKRESNAKILLPGENGKLMCHNDEWILIYNDSNPAEISRFTIAHELGHFLLGHHEKYEKYKDTRDTSKKSQSEQQADMFACRLLCPACVLWGLDLHTPEDIAHYCGIEISIANERAQRMKLLYERNKFLTSPREIQLYEAFKPFIDEINSSKA